MYNHHPFLDRIFREINHPPIGEPPRSVHSSCCELQVQAGVHKPTGMRVAIKTVRGLNCGSLAALAEKNWMEKVGKGDGNPIGWLATKEL